MNEGYKPEGDPSIDADVVTWREIEGMFGQMIPLEAAKLIAGLPQSPMYPPDFRAALLAIRDKVSAAPDGQDMALCGKCPPGTDGLCRLAGKCLA